MSSEADNKDGKDSTEASATTAKKSKKGLFIGLALIVVVIAIGVPVFLMLNKEKTKEKSSAEKVEIDLSVDGRESRLEAEAEEELEEGEELLGALVPFDPFVLNLKNSRFVKFQIQLEFVERDIPKKFFQRAPIIRDGIITLVNNRSGEDLLEREGKEKLRKDIRNVINEALHKELVKQVYFTQFVVQ
jgi:flagellar FliL protein